MVTDYHIKIFDKVLFSTRLYRTSTGNVVPTPPPSEFVDAESSVNVPLPTTEGRYIKLTFSFDPSPSNAVQVAFGRDLNADGDLAPEETELIVGCDCGEIQVKVEGEIERSEIAEGLREQRNVQVSFEEQESDLHGSPSPPTFTLKQSRIVSDRWTLAKVTTHNLADTNLTVTADFYTKGTTLILR